MPIEAVEPMTQAPQQRRTHIESSSSTKKQLDRVQRDELARKCQIVFDRVYPQLIEDRYNWHISRSRYRTISNRSNFNGNNSTNQGYLWGAIDSQINDFST